MGFRSTPHPSKAAESVLTWPTREHHHLGSSEPTSRLPVLASAHVVRERVKGIRESLPLLAQIPPQVQGLDSTSPLAPEPCHSGSTPLLGVPPVAVSLPLTPPSHVRVSPCPALRPSYPPCFPCWVRLVQSTPFWPRYPTREPHVTQPNWFRSCCWGGLAHALRNNALANALRRVPCQGGSFASQLGRQAGRER